jgi:hypothetical protein
MFKLSNDSNFNENDADYEGSPTEYLQAQLTAYNTGSNGVSTFDSLRRLVDKIKTGSLVDTPDYPINFGLDTIVAQMAKPNDIEWDELFPMEWSVFGGGDTTENVKNTTENVKKTLSKLPNYTYSSMDIYTLASQGISLDFADWEKTSRDTKKVLASVHSLRMYAFAEDGTPSKLLEWLCSHAYNKMRLGAEELYDYISKHAPSPFMSPINLDDGQTIIFKGMLFSDLTLSTSRELYENITNPAKGINKIMAKLKLKKSNKPGTIETKQIIPSHIRQSNDVIVINDSDDDVPVLRSHTGKRVEEAKSIKSPSFKNPLVRSVVKERREWKPNYKDLLEDIKSETKAKTYAEFLSHLECIRKEGDKLFNMRK